MEYLIHEYPVNFMLLALSFVMSIALYIFFLFHFYIMSRNQTTNEYFK